MLKNVWKLIRVYKKELYTQNKKCGKREFIMVKTITNKNVDEVLFEQLKGINFEYLVQLNGLIEDYTDEFGADTLDKEMVTFDITLHNALKSRMEELLVAEKRVKEIVEEDREEKQKVKYVEEAREYLESISDDFDNKIVDGECLEIIERLKKTIYNFGSLETQINVLKTLLETDTYKDEETVERAILAGFLASLEVVREVEQKELDKNREYINAIKIEDTKEIGFLIDGYELNGNMNFTHWFMLNKYGLAHIDEVFLVEYIENERMNLVFQDGKDMDLSEPYCL